MSVIVAFLSQKGGVGKSTLARSLAVVAAKVGLRVTLADLDPQQRTLMRWQMTRTELGLRPEIEVKAFNTAEEVLNGDESADLIVLDLPGQLSDTAALVGQGAHLIVQPTSPSVDDLHPAVLVFQALEKVKVPPERLAFALCRVLGEKEAEATRKYLEHSGYSVLRGFIAERLSYRDALNLGRSLVESRQASLNTAAQLMLLDMLDRALTLGLAAQASAEPRASTRRHAHQGSR
jgi:chromosome partitioning protein